MSRRVLVIALDGTTFDLIGPWLDDGSMPTLARLRSEGASGPLQSIVPPVTAPAWCSFMTGKNPGKHGVFEFFMREPGSFEEIPVNSGTRSGRTLWELLGDAGKKVLVCNVPVTYPPTPVNGHLVGDFLTPMGERNFTWPPGLLAEIEEATGPYELYHVEVYRKGRARLVLDELDRVLEANRKANRWLIENKPWDFAMFHVWGTDRFGHELWHILDERHPMHDPAEAHICRDRVLAYWRRVDQVVGDWIVAAGDDVTTVVLSDHGFGPIHRFLVFNVWLLNEGWIRLKPGVVTFLKRSLFELGLSPALGYRMSMKLGFARMRLAAGVGTRRRLINQINRLFLSLNDVDWSRTKVYSKGNYGQLFLNLKGREPYGIVEPGESEAVLDDVTRGLEALRDPETGEPLIGDIWRREELYEGPFVDRGPDLTFLPRDMRNKALGTVDFTSHRFVERAYGNSGDHRMNGIFFMHGEGVRPGYTMRDANLIDVAPTILHYLGQGVPEDFDGRVLVDAFTVEEAGRAVQTAPPAIGGGDGTDLSEENMREIRERLKGLGYLG